MYTHPQRPRPVFSVNVMYLLMCRRWAGRRRPQARDLRNLAAIIVLGAASQSSPNSANNGTTTSPNAYYHQNGAQPQSVVLENSSCNVRPGELIGVIGHMGSGKSTFVSAIAGEEHK